VQMNQTFYQGETTKTKSSLSRQSKLQHQHATGSRLSSGSQQKKLNAT